MAAILNLTHRGFTGHLQVDHANVIHMGGRIYDAHIGRFLQADPFVQAPSNSQSHNRYSYVLNNPLSYTDPSGYFFKALKKYWKVVVAAVASYYTFGIASAWASGWVGGVIGGAAAGFVGGAIASGSLKGALQGAFSGALFGGIGGALGNAHTAVQVGAHALAGGVISTMQGGKFGHGFFSAGFTKWAGKAWSLETSKDVIGNSLKQAIIGGTASKITGNKFANGAFTAALQYIVNEVASWERNNQEIQDEKLAVGASSKALTKVLGTKALELGIEFDSDGNLTPSASANLKNLKISLNSEMQATIIAGPSALVGTTFSVYDQSQSAAVASFGLAEISVAAFDNGVINYSVQLGAGGYVKYSGGVDLRNLGSVGTIIRAAHFKETQFNSYVCKNLSGVKGC